MFYGAFDNEGHYRRDIVQGNVFIHISGISRQQQIQIGCWDETVWPTEVITEAFFRRPSWGIGRQHDSTRHSCPESVSLKRSIFANNQEDVSLISFSK